MNWNSETQLIESAHSLGSQTQLMVLVYARKLSLLLIQEGHLSATWLLAKECAGKGVDRFTDRLDMIIVLDWDVEQHPNKQTNDI